MSQFKFLDAYLNMQRIVLLSLSLSPVYFVFFLRWLCSMFPYLILNWKLTFKHNLIVGGDFDMVLAAYPRRKKCTRRGYVPFQGFISLGDLIILSIAKFLFRWFIGKIYINKKKRRIKDEGSYLHLVESLENLRELWPFT